MFACVETCDRIDNSIELLTINDRAVELAEELAAEGADEETLDNFADNCAEDWQTIELLIMIARGEVKRQDNGTFHYVGEEVTIGVGDSWESAKAAYVDARLS